MGASIEELRRRLEDTRGVKEDILNRIEENKADRLSVDTESARIDYLRSLNALEEELDDAGKAVLARRRALEKSLSKYKTYKVLFTALYLALAIIVFVALDLGFQAGAIITYIIAIIGSVFVYIFSMKKSCNGCKEELKETYSSPSILEYDERVTDLHKELEARNRESFEHLGRIDAEGRRLKEQLNHLINVENELTIRISDFEFNQKYKDNILFYGMDRGNHYDIYLDGHHYDTVKGKQIERIILTPGLHSFKVENTAYNIDNSIIYCFEFNTQQIQAGETEECFAIVCEYRSIKRVTGTEFQKITKTRLI